MDRKTIEAEVKKRVGEKRFCHILGTENECIRLAGIFDLCDDDAKKLSYAALMHDITKEMSRDEQIALMDSLGRSFDEHTLQNDKTLHAVSGAFLARSIFPDVTDDVVFTSILFHTTGKEDMSIYQKILYLADYIEPTRSNSSCVGLRNYFEDMLSKHPPYEALDKALVYSFNMTIRHLLDTDEYIHPDTVAARNFLIKKER